MNDFDSTSLPIGEFLEVPTTHNIATLTWLKLDRRQFGTIARIFAYTTHDDVGCLLFRMHKPQETSPITFEIGSISVLDIINQQESFPSTIYNHFTRQLNQQSQLDKEPLDLSIHSTASISHIQCLTPNLIALALSTGAIAMVHLKIVVTSDDNKMNDGSDDQDGDLVQYEFIKATCVHFITFDHLSRSSALQSSFSITAADSFFYPQQQSTTLTNNKPIPNAIMHLIIGTDSGITYGIQYTAPLSLVNHLEFSSAHSTAEAYTHNPQTHPLIQAMSLKLYSLNPLDYLITLYQHLSPQVQQLILPPTQQPTAITSLQLTPSTLSIAIFGSKHILQFSFLTILHILQHLPALTTTTLTTPIAPQLALTPAYYCLIAPLLDTSKQAQNINNNNNNNNTTTIFTPLPKINLSTPPPTITSATLSKFITLLFIPSNFTFPYRNNQAQMNTLSTHLLLSKHSVATIPTTANHFQQLATPSLSSAPSLFHRGDVNNAANLLFVYDQATSALFVFNPVEGDNSTNKGGNDAIISPTLPQLIIPLLHSSQFQPEPAPKTTTTNDATITTTVGTPTKQSNPNSTANGTNTSEKMTTKADFDILYSRPPQQSALHTFNALSPISISVYPHLSPLNQSFGGGSNTSPSFSQQTPSQKQSSTEQHPLQSTILLHTNTNQLFSLNLTKLLADNTPKYQLNGPVVNHHHIQQMVRYVPISQIYPTPSSSPSTTSSSHQQYQPSLFTSHPFVSPNLHQTFLTNCGGSYDPSSSCTLLAQGASIHCGYLGQ